MLDGEFNDENYGLFDYDMYGIIRKAFECHEFNEASL